MTSLVSPIRILFVTRPASPPFLRTALVHTKNSCRIQFRTSTTSTNSQHNVQSEASIEDRPETVMRTPQEPVPSTRKPPKFGGWNKLPQEVRQWSLVAVGQSRGMLSSVVAAMQTNLAVIGGKLNEVTGYERIEDLKRRVHQQGRRSIPRLFVSVLTSRQSNDFRRLGKQPARQRLHMKLPCRFALLRSGT
jgi:hypothetical protein